MDALAIARRIGSRRFFGMLAGVCLCGLGISVFKLAAMGNDAYSALVFALSARFPIGFGTMLLLINALFFLGECIWGRQMIGLGTVVNWLCVGYVADFFSETLFVCVPAELALPVRGMLMLAGVCILCLGGSMYQTADVGIAPYDALSLIMAERLPLKYFWCRIITDASCFAACLLLGGLTGVGTFVCALGLGPVISFFDKYVSRPLLGRKKE